MLDPVDSHLGAEHSEDGGQQCGPKVVRLPLEGRHVPHLVGDESR